MASISTLIACMMIVHAPMPPQALPPHTSRQSLTMLVRSRTCKQVDSCAEAVDLWCDGYNRADGDNDGIPCENVCSSREEVEALEGDRHC
jgi:hypothetical protein